MNYYLIAELKDLISKKPKHYWNRSTEAKWFDINQLKSLELSKAHYENGWTIETRPCI